ncbi:MAG: VanW family protein [Clostridia bacterium]|nr:VanW family protein [Clostridia bacterium]
MGGGFGSGGYRFDGDARDDELESGFEEDRFEDEYDDDYDDYDDRRRDDYDDDAFDDDFDDGYFGRGGLDDDFDDDFDDRYNRRGSSQRNRGRAASSRREDSRRKTPVSRINYDDFEDKSYYRFDDGSGRRASRNVVPDRPRREPVKRQEPELYDDNRRRKKRAEVKAQRKTDSYYDYEPADTDWDDDAYYDDDGYFDDGGYNGRDRAPAARTPEAIPPIYAKYLGNGDGYYEEHYGKTARKNNAVSLQTYRTRKRLKVLGIVTGCAAVVLLIAYYLAFIRIYRPVEIANSIVNLQTADATTMLRSVIGTQLSDKTLYMVVNGETFSMNLGEYGFNYSSDADGSTNTVSDIGEDGKEIKTTTATYGNISYNQTKLEELLNSISDKYGKTMVKPSYTIEGDQLVIKSGSDGIGIDEASLMKEVLERIKQGNYDERLMEEMVTTQAPEVDIDKIYKEVVCDVKDASSYVDENGETIYSSDVVGKKFNLEEARSTVAAGGNTWSIPLKLTQPKVTLVELKAPTCPDLLAETTTEFKATNKTRAANIKNAAKRINTYGSFEEGYVLQPLEIFSFNDTVGERTEANGFSIATVYTNTGTTNDVGGGICQVSSAIFSAAFKADLEITSRTNHMYKVHYWTTPGEDATVNWGTLDFKFQNNKTYPIKIKMIYQSKGGKGTITCQIWGTNDGYRCEFDNKVVQMVKTPTVQKKAVTGKPRGTKEWGDPGLTVEIYRVRYKDDVKISKELYATSIYQPLPTVEYV